MKVKELISMLGATNAEADVLINLHGKLYEIAASVVFAPGVKDDSIAAAVRIDLNPVSPPAPHKFEAD